MTSMSDEVNNINKVAATQAERITKDTGKREVNEASGFRRDVQDDKFKFSEHGIVLIEEFLKYQGVDNREYLNTDYDPLVDEGDVSLIHPLLLNRLQSLLYRGAEKYGEGNWERGDYMSRTFDSLVRHMLQFYLGDTSEDHLAAIVFNTMCLMVYEHNIQHELPFFDEDGNAIGYFKEFADIGALWLDDEKYDMPHGSSEMDIDADDTMTQSTVSMNYGVGDILNIFNNLDQ